jgi:hypothetical protein
MSALLAKADIGLSHTADGVLTCRLPPIIVLIGTTPRTTWAGQNHQSINLTTSRRLAE